MRDSMWSTAPERISSPATSSAQQRASGSTSISVWTGRAKEPVQMGVGPVPDLEDAVAKKTLALYGRGAARDFLGVDAIRCSGRFSDKQLLRMRAKHGPGFAASCSRNRYRSHRTWTASTSPRTASDRRRNGLRCVKPV